MQRVDDMKATQWSFNIHSPCTDISIRWACVASYQGRAHIERATAETVTVITDTQVGPAGLSYLLLNVVMHRKRIEVAHARNKHTTPLERMAVWTSNSLANAFAIPSAYVNNCLAVHYTRAWHTLVCAHVCSKDKKQECRAVTLMLVLLFSRSRLQLLCTRGNTVRVLGERQVLTESANHRRVRKTSRCIYAELSVRENKEP
ncbi:hypothetical protein EV401DRAFT_1941138 [Pisolithus croceorrhizus]|nr:hypothetical protein EV401DRAFT_1941138 [Pisolithus croceorrhizus]